MVFIVVAAAGIDELAFLEIKRLTGVRFSRLAFRVIQQSFLFLLITGGGVGCFRGQCSCLLEAVHLLSSVDEEGLCTSSSIRIDHNRNAETLLKRAQVGAFVVEQIKSNF